MATHLFGRNRKQAYDVILEATDAGPFDGGCLFVAKALQKRLGGEIFVLETASGRADHAVLKVGDRFIDFDGPADSAGEMVHRFNFNEMAHAVGVRPFREGDLPEAPPGDEFVDRLVKLMPGGRHPRPSGVLEDFQVAQERRGLDQEVHWVDSGENRHSS